MPLSAHAARAAQATSSEVAWLPLLTFRLPGGDVGEPVPDLPAGNNSLSPGGSLGPGESLVSDNKWYRATMQGDGNFVVISKSNRVMWSSGTAGNPGARLQYQGDGNIVVVSASGTPLWYSGTHPNPQRLVMQHDGNLVSYGTDNVAQWHINYTSSVEPRESTLRVVANTEDVISRGMVFQATHFEINLPNDDGETFPYVELKIANVDGLLIQAIRAFRNPPEMTLEIVLSDMPDLVERKVDFLRLSSCEFNALTISGRLSVESSLTNRFPAYDYGPAAFPGLFS
jgi:hypothetical protein